jgi:hydrogenase maturation protease
VHFLRDALSETDDRGRKLLTGAGFAVRCLVVGVGNDFRRDDGAGIVAARRLRAAAIPGVQVVEACGEGAGLMDIWSGAPCVHLVDASRSGAAPGTIRRIDATTQTVPADLFHYSSHAFGVAEAVEMARALGALPPRLVLHAVEGADFSVGEGLTPVVKAAVDRLVRDLAAELLAG